MARLERGSAATRRSSWLEEDGSFLPSATSQSCLLPSKGSNMCTLRKGRPDTACAVPLWHRWEHLIAPRDAFTTLRNTAGSR